MSEGDEMTELQLGKYEFYPYPNGFIEPSPTLEELVELLQKAKAKSEKDVKKPRDPLTDADHFVNDVAKCSERRKVVRVRGSIPELLG